MFCPWCGMPNQDGVNYCITCGKEVNSVIHSSSVGANSQKISENRYIIFIFVAIGFFFQFFSLVKILKMVPSWYLGVIPYCDAESVLLIPLFSFGFYFILCIIGFFITIKFGKKAIDIPISRNSIIGAFLAMVIGVGFGIFIAL